MSNRKVIIFTDLDGTLLDHDSYSWAGAQQALNKLLLHNIPIIFCTSKTKDETTYFRSQIGSKDPFIVENGAVIYSPPDYFDFPVSDQLKDGYEAKIFGTPYSRLRNFIQSCHDELKVQLLGFGDLNTKKIQELTNLPKYQAELAGRREFIEPFYFLNKKSEKKLQDIKILAKKNNLVITKGWRFYHISGRHDKGYAVQTVIDFFRKNDNHEPISIGLGESLNDLSLLQNVTIPCLLKNAHGQYEPEIVSKISPRLAENKGPEGWNKIVLEILAEYDI